MDTTRNKRGFVSKRRYEVTTVRFYNLIAQAEVSCIEQIPSPVLFAISVLNYTQICRPLVAHDLRAGCSIGMCQQRYGVSEGFVRTVKKQL